MGVERLYYNDSYLTKFTARVIDRDAEGRRIYLDRTAFYPDSGGQPHDTGTIGDAVVLDVVDEGERIAHVTGAPVGNEVRCSIDWPRRFDHMQQHSGQHLLSAVLVDLFGIQTVGFHLGAEASTIDVAAPALERRQVEAAEARANALVFENRALSVSYQDSSEPQDLRKASGREGTLRIVSIEGVDRSACGGTHVRATGEIGPVLIRKLEKVRGNTRIEFLCGMRAVRRARADFDALSSIARTFSAALDESPALVAAQSEALQSVEKSRRRLSSDLARVQGRELYASTAPAGSGLRIVVRRLSKGALDEDLRATAQGFTAQPRAVFLAAVEDPPAILIAVSKDAGVHAGDELKKVLAKTGGRGGGNALQAQASLPGRDALDQALELLAGIPG